LLSMGRTWAEVFWRPSDTPDVAEPGTPYLIAIAGLSALTLAMTVGAEPLFDVASRAAAQLLQHDEYVRAVLTETR